MNELNRPAGPWRGFLIGLSVLGLTACAARPPETSVIDNEGAARTSEAQRISELEKQLVDRQKQCAEDKRRLDASLKETQKRLDETQKKLDAVLAIERDVRRSRNR